MGLEKDVRRSVRARYDDEDDYELVPSEEEEGEEAEEGEDEKQTDELKGSSSDTEEDMTSDGDSIGFPADDGPPLSLNDVSFGALARAQESFMPPPRPEKRKRTGEDGGESSTVRSQREDEAAAAAAAGSSFSRLAQPPSPSSHQHRISKHAPQTISSRHAVSRKRTIIEPSAALKSRDPRFDPVGLHPGASHHSLETQRANENYSFLTSYRRSELQELQTRLKAALANPGPGRQKPSKGSAPAADPETIATLKREINSLTAKLRSSETKSREREILRAHRRKEKEAIREGRKTRPFHLKKAEVRKEIERERTEGMGKRAREKRDLRRQKRDKGREGRGLPRFRRRDGRALS